MKLLVPSIKQLSHLQLDLLVKQIVDLPKSCKFSKKSRPI